MFNASVESISDPALSVRIYCRCCNERISQSRIYAGAANTVLERMHSEKVPFTFLMPCKRPYDFRYIYDQCMQESKR